jgi:Cu-Zn family superoxide dismutase
MRARGLLGLGIGAALTLGVPVAAAQHEHHTGAETGRAVAVLAPTGGNTARGTVTFERAAGGVRIMAQLEGLPAGDHGFHIHEFGDCSAADGASAGGHYNPAGAVHAGPEATARHVGDLGNLTADTRGIARYDRTDPIVRLDGPQSVIGRSVIVHAGADDLSSQPTGNAGARLACGVIGVAK